MLLPASMTRRSEFVLLGIVGATAVLVLLALVCMHGAANRAPIDVVSTLTETAVDANDVLVQPEREASEPTVAARTSERAVAIRPDISWVAPAHGNRHGVASLHASEPPATDGLVRTYHADGRLESEGYYRDGVREGYWVDYAENGTKQLAGTYVRGRAEGLWTAWDENERVRAEAQCREGKFDGLCRFWLADGALDAERSGLYKNGERIAAR